MQSRNAWKLRVNTPNKKQKPFYTFFFSTMEATQLFPHTMASILFETESLKHMKQTSDNLYFAKLLAAEKKSCIRHNRGM